MFNSQSVQSCPSLEEPHCASPRFISKVRKKASKDARLEGQSRVAK